MQTDIATLHSDDPWPIRDASVWTAADFPETRSWVRPLTPAMLAELDSAIRAAKASGLPFWELTPDRFPLQTAAPMLKAALDDLERGRGFAVVGGFPVDRYSRDDALIGYALICGHLGKITEQTHKHDHMIEVVDLQKPYDHTSRGYASNKLLPFHTDGADFVGLLALGEPAEGGKSILVSASHVYNVLRAERPDLYPVLRRGYHHPRRGEQAPGEPPVSRDRIPVFSFHGGLLHVMYNRNPIDWVRHEGMELDAREVEALDVLDAISARRENQLFMDMRKGDIQFVNNFVILHSRTDYRDDETHRRHLLRIWLSNQDGRRTGPTLLDLYAPWQVRRRAG
ncbi:MAG: TauD/TfdA family dioxygenase [Pseudomonadota bacterium]|nr:TauD/TfdA family dioxygenase [Pseudomonadota bacterium]